MDEGNGIKIKLQNVLTELLKSDYRVSDDTILEKLITHLSEAPHLIENELCTGWVQSALILWLQDKTSSSVASFALRLAGIMMKTESNFNHFCTLVDPVLNRPFSQQLLEIIQSDSRSLSSFSIKCAYLKMLSSLVGHSSGRKWVLDTCVWQNVLRMSVGDPSLYVVREARQFFCGLVNNTTSPDKYEVELEEILFQILSSILTPPEIQEGSSSNMSEITPYAVLLCELLENAFLSNDPETNKIQSVIVEILFKPRFDTLKKTTKLLETTEDRLFEEHLSKVIVFTYMLDMIKDGRRLEDQVIEEKCTWILDIINILITKGSMHNVLKLCFACHNNWMYFRKIHPHVDSSGEQDAKKFMFEDQLLSLQMTPVCIGVAVEETMPAEVFIYDWSQKLWNPAVKVMYAYRDAIVKDKSCLNTLPVQAIASVKALRNALPRESAVLMFQSLTYVLKHFISFDECESKRKGCKGWGGEYIRSHQSTMTATLEQLCSLVRTYRIKWRESVESLSLLNFALQVIESPLLSSNVGLVVQAFQLIGLSIENFMPTNLALLTNSLSGTCLERLGPLIYKRLHDSHWEVRDSSLEVLHIVATISHMKYPLFQDFIIDNKLTEITVCLALNDAESYVCASAMKCLTAMVCVDRLWNEELNNKDLVSKVIRVLNGESEGVVRREASLLITEIFKHRKVAPDVMKKMCTTMSNVVVSDLHWEVKVNALSFWELVIECKLSDQGMIDGCFPQVTFSKEHRKIIRLTPTAIQERLLKVLDELSGNGCLYVLLAAVCTEEDLEVVKKASKIIATLSKVLQHHSLLKLPASPVESVKIPELFHPVVVPPKNENEPVVPGLSNDVAKSLFNVDPQSMGFAVFDEEQVKLHHQEKVIDAILDDRDINLLVNVYQGTGAELGGREGPETKVIKPTRPAGLLKPCEFLQHLATLNIEKLVNERIRWVADVGSHLDTLLDDMLISRVIVSDGEEECNAMDCY